MIDFLQTRSVLIVEDEQDILEAFKQTFESFFGTVYTAKDGVDALDIFEKNSIDAIFSDYSMPNMDGYELAKQIRQIDQNIPITIISNFKDSDKLQKCIPLKLSGYLFKPLTYSELHAYLVELNDAMLSSQKIEYTFSDKHTLSLSTHTISVNGEFHSLTKMEYRFLKYMIENTDTLISNEKIHELLRDFDPNDRTVRNLVYRLKSKYHIQNIRNIKDSGYLLVDYHK
ncbi:response regulator transcription factor [Sulfurimonas sp.]|nr:response regulator transcription factor [Sulfurimonas sp.]